MISKVSERLAKPAGMQSGRMPMRITTAFMALSISCLPATALAQPASSSREMTVAGASEDRTNQSAVDLYYNRWQGPAWFSEEGRPAAELARILRRAPLDGLAAGPAIAQRVEQASQTAQSGGPADISAAERILSAAWITYVEAIRQPTRNMTYGYPTLAPRAEDAADILAKAANAPSLVQHLADVSAVNPIYTDLRDAAWRKWQAAPNITPDPRIIANLERLRSLPATGRFVLVNIATQQLEMYEDGRIVDSMKVIVGSRQHQTPMIASVIYYTTLNPYWNVPAHLVRATIAPNVLRQGLGYLKSRGYQVMTDWTENADVIPPEQISWKAVASGAKEIRVRQLPGPGNSMGKIKFSFANGHDIYLHDTPSKNLFVKDDRYLSNGCIRLEDATRFGRWLVNNNQIPSSDKPEHFVPLPKGIPIYITYITAKINLNDIIFANDIYDIDGKSFEASEAVLTN